MNINFQIASCLAKRYPEKICGLLLLAPSINFSEYYIQRLRKNAPPELLEVLEKGESFEYNDPKYGPYPLSLSVFQEMIPYELPLEEEGGYPVCCPVRIIHGTEVGSNQWAVMYYYSVIYVFFFNWIYVICVLRFECLHLLILVLNVIVGIDLREVLVLKKEWIHRWEVIFCFLLFDSLGCKTNQIICTYFNYTFLFQDTYSPYMNSLKLVTGFETKDVQLTYIKGTGHHLDDPDSLEIIYKTILSMMTILQSKL